MPLHLRAVLKHANHAEQFQYGFKGRADTFPRCRVRRRQVHPAGVAAVLDLVGNSTVLDSLAAVRSNGRVCMAGFLGGDRAAAGVYQAKPARVFGFEEIQDPHRLMESGQASGKIVVAD